MGKSKMLNRDELLSMPKVRVEKVNLEVREGFVYVREMMAKEKDAFELTMMIEKKVKRNRTDLENDFTNARAKLAVYTICNDQGTLVFSPADAEFLGDTMPSTDMDIILDVARKLNRITLEDMEEWEKNSDPGQTKD